MQGKKVVIGLSGGLDSFVTAYLLKEEGYSLIAVSFKLYNNEESIEKAGYYASRLNIPFYVKDIRKVFDSKIVKPFIKAYLNAKTPNPCTWCNKEIKAAFLYQFMREEQADFFATGHYVKIKKFNNQYFIFRGKDKIKDQSYFLWNLPQKYLRYWKTPLGDYLKKEIRQKAIDWSFPELASKKESMGVCFLQNKSYADFIVQNKAIEEKILKGNLIGEQGEILGQHKGIPFYTIGQKKGLPFYDKNKAVSKIDVNTRNIYISKEDKLYVSSFNLVNYYFADNQDMLSSHLSVWVRGIGRNPKGYCRLVKRGKLLQVNLDEKAYAIAPGQPVAFYIKDRLVGGGFVAAYNFL